MEGSLQQSPRNLSRSPSFHFRPLCERFDLGIAQRPVASVLDYTVLRHLYSTAQSFLSPCCVLILGLLFVFLRKPRLSKLAGHPFSCCKKSCFNLAVLDATDMDHYPYIFPSPITSSVSPHVCQRKEIMRPSMTSPNQHGATK